MTDITIPCLRRTNPTVPVHDPRFVWTKFGDCQAIWRRFGWRPLGELDAGERPVQYAHITPVQQAA